jgi:hypothetical protein
MIFLGQIGNQFSVMNDIQANATSFVMNRRMKRVGMIGMIGMIGMTEMTRSILMNFIHKPNIVCEDRISLMTFMDLITHIASTLDC